MRCPVSTWQRPNAEVYWTQADVPFDVVRRLGNEESLEVQVDFDARVGVDGDGRVDAVVSGNLNSDQQQVQLDETEPVQPAARRHDNHCILNTSI